MSGLFVVAAHSAGPIGEWTRALAVVLPQSTPLLETERTYVSRRATGAIGSFHSEPDLAVAVEGYFAEPCGNDAKLVAERYRTGGLEAVERLDGSFVIVLTDLRARRVHLWSDRTASVPFYFARVGEIVAAASSANVLGALPGVDRELVPGSLAAMALNGALIDERTYWRGVHLLGPARRLTIGNGRVELARYWERSFPPDVPERLAGEEELRNRATDAVARHLSRFDRPVLALSGGFDSRLILAACREAGIPVAAATWGFDHVETPGSDYRVAIETAARDGIPHTGRVLDVDRLPDNAERVVRLTDGFAGHLGNFPEGDAMAAELAKDHDAVVFGNEMFGWATHASSTAVALRRIGIQTGRRLRLLRFLLRREVRDRVLGDYEAQWKRLVDEPRAQISERTLTPDALKDALYWQTRFPRLLATQTPIFREHVSYASPLLDHELLDLVSGLPDPQRVNKRWVVEQSNRAFPDAFEIELNRRHSRTDWRTRLSTLGPAPRFLVETLLAPGDSAFDDWFDRNAIQAWLSVVTAEGARVRPSAKTTAIRRLRAHLLRRASTPRIVVALCALKLWFVAYGSR